MPFPVDPRFIQEAEKKLGRSFPPSFHNGMAILNGGEVDTGTDNWQLFPVFDTSDKKRIRRTCNHILKETQSAKRWTAFPPEAVTIGANGCGDLLVLLPEESGSDRLKDVVYWWNHETGEVKIASPTIASLMDKRS